jgi:hypothetical protein
MILLTISVIGWIWVFFTIRRLMIANHCGAGIVTEIKEDIQSIKTSLKELE